MNREECIREMNSALQELDVDLKKTDFFITHLHADHLGLVANLASDTSKVYYGERRTPGTSTPRPGTGLRGAPVHCGLLRLDHQSGDD